MKLRLCRADVGLRPIRSRPFSAVGALGEGLASGVVAEGDDTSEAAFGSDALAVEGEEFGKKFAISCKPGVEGTGEFDRLDAIDVVVDRSVAGHGEQTGFLVAPGKADQRGATFDQGARTCARWL